jgi:hypothetical protein
MEGIHFLDLFQGIATLVASEPKIMFGRIFLMLLGFLADLSGLEERSRAPADDPDGTGHVVGQRRRDVPRRQEDGNAVRRPVDVRSDRSDEHHADRLAATDLHA